MALTESVLPGTAAELRSAGATELGSALQLSASSGGFEYALYRFNLAGVGAVGPDSVSILLEQSVTSAAWIGLADYERGVWQFSGPFSAGKTLAMDEPRFVSPAGNLWIAVLVPGAASATVNALSVRTINPENVPPNASFTLTPGSGTAPLTVDFDASASSDSDGTIIEYAWDFDGDGLYEGFSTTPQLSNTYTLSGSYAPALRVTDDHGAFDFQIRALEINAPPLAMLDTPALSVEKGSTVQLSAEGSSDPDGGIADHSWDLDGDDVFGEPGAEAAAQGSATALLTLGDVPGNYAVAVRVTDTDGATDTAELTLTVRGWLSVDVVFPPDSPEFISLAVIAGKPAISFMAHPDEDLHYAYSTSSDGSSGWTAIILETDGASGYYNSMTEVNGRPAISYGVDSPDYQLKYAYSSVPDGSSGWSFVIVDNAGEVGYGTSLAVVNGKPAIAYQNATDSSLNYAYSSTVDGSSGWSITIVDDSGGTPYEPCLRLVNGRPAISYNDFGNQELRYAYSAEPDGSGNWTALTVDNGGGRYSSLAVINGKPAISYRHNTGTWLRYAYSDSADGSSNWNTVDIAAGGGFPNSLALVDGRPAIAYWDSSQFDLSFATSSTADGSSGWSRWVVDAEGLTGEYASMTVVNGKPAIAYRDNSRVAVRYAVLYE